MTFDSDVANYVRHLLLERKQPFLFQPLILRYPSLPCTENIFHQIRQLPEGSKF